MRAVLSVHRLQIVVAHLFVSLDTIDHNACDDFASQQPRFALDLVHLLDRPLATFEPFLRDRPDHDRYLRALVVLLRGRVEAVAIDLRWQVCDGDLHGGNTHRQPDGSLVFFELSSAGPATQQCARNRDVSIVSVCIRGPLT